MNEINTVPEVVNIHHYAGDTLTLRVRIAPELVAGRVWSAHLKSDRVNDAPDAEWDIVPDAEGAVLTLPSATTTMLAATGTVVRDRNLRRTVQRYTGEWDVQLSPPGGGDPSTTLFQGELILDLDVTREI